MEVEFHDFSDQMLPCKGRRTKRPRVSPLVGVAVNSSPFGDSDGGDCYSPFVHSPASSCSRISTSTEEDKDMAHCLILLARSGCQTTTMTTAAAATTTTSVYECKTCNRKFSSFQALGGHRASHSKPKLTQEDHKKSTPFNHHHDQDNHKEIQHKIHDKLNKTKIHECSVCGLLFYSGQALGGHMRRHRPLHINTTTTMKASMDDNEEKPRPVFTLDLNLPAPNEDKVDNDEDNTTLEFSAKQQSPAFSCPAFVDCHY